MLDSFTLVSSCPWEGPQRGTKATRTRPSSTEAVGLSPFDVFPQPAGMPPTYALTPGVKDRRDKPHIGHNERLNARRAAREGDELREVIAKLEKQLAGEATSGKGESGNSSGRHEVKVLEKEIKDERKKVSRPGRGGGGADPESLPQTVRLEEELAEQQIVAAAQLRRPRALAEEGGPRHSSGFALAASQHTRRPPPEVGRCRLSPRPRPPGGARDDSSSSDCAWREEEQGRDA